MRHSRAWLLLGAGAVLVTSTQAAAQERMQGSGIKISKERPVVSSTPAQSTTTVVVGGEVELTTPFALASYLNMNEKNMTAHMATGDSLEIEISRLAQTKATDSRVRDYASMLVNDHTAHLAKTTEIITDEDVGAEPLVDDPEELRMRQTLAGLRNMAAGASWDAAFLRFQVDHHQNELAIWTNPTIVKNAHDDDLEEHIKKTTESLTKHRDTAQSVATTLGVY
jgi:predicted outer membrane protein